MLSQKVKSSITSIIIVAVLVMSPAVFAENQKVKAVFDFRIGDPAAGAFVLKAIQQIHAAKPNQDIIVVFGGNSPVLLSTEREGVTPENQKYLDEIATRVSEMAQDDIKLEVCLIAVEDVNKIDPASLLSDLEHVADAWISLIEYELGGYAIVPVF